MVPVLPLQQKPTPPTWQIEGPFSELAFTYAGARKNLRAEPVTQNFEKILLKRHDINQINPVSSGNYCCHSHFEFGFGFQKK